MLNEQLQKQIEQEGAEHESATPHEGVGIGIYSAGAYRYAALWQAAEEKATRYENALKEISEIHRSVSGAYKMQAIANYALTPKTGEDEG